MVGCEGMGKAITEELKKQISELYRSSDLTNFEIAKALDVSPRSVRRYKNYDGMVNLSSAQISQSNPTIESIEEPDNIEYENETMPELCPDPDCGELLANFIRLDQLDEDDPPPTEEELQKYTHICPKCHELIKISD